MSFHVTSRAGGNVLERSGTSARHGLASSCLIVVFFAGGCYHFHAYQIGGPEGREQGNQPATEWQHKTLHAFFWGLVRQDLPIDNCRLASGQRLGVEEVKITTNFGYLLGSVFTLGLWVPVEISWRCARPPVETGTLR